MYKYLLHLGKECVIMTKNNRCFAEEGKNGGK